MTPLWHRWLSQYLFVWIEPLRRRSCLHQDRQPGPKTVPEPLTCVLAVTMTRLRRICVNSLFSADYRKLFMWRRRTRTTAPVRLTNHSSDSACQPERVLRLCGQSENRNHNHARQLWRRSNGVKRTMSGDEGMTNQNAEVIPDAGDAAIPTTQPRRWSRVCSVRCAVCLCAQVQKHQKVIRLEIMKIIKTWRRDGATAIRFQKILIFNNKYKSVLLCYHWDKGRKINAYKFTLDLL